MEMTVGIIGAGRIGKIHVENLRKLRNVKVKSVSDVQVSHLQEWAKETGIDHLTTDYRELLADPSISVVRRKLRIRQLSPFTDRNGAGGLVL